MTEYSGTVPMQSGLAPQKYREVSILTDGYLYLSILLDYQQSERRQFCRYLGRSE